MKILSILIALSILLAGCERTQPDGNNKHAATTPSSAPAKITPAQPENRPLSPGLPPPQRDVTATTTRTVANIMVCKGLIMSGIAAMEDLAGTNSEDAGTEIYFVNAFRKNGGVVRFNCLSPKSSDVVTFTETEEKPHIMGTARPEIITLEIDKSNSSPRACTVVPDK